MPLATAERGRETRERLLHAAASLIVEVGWGQVSTRTVAQRAGVPAGAVHYHYSSVNALLRAAVAPPLRALAGELTAELAEVVDLPTGIHRLVDAVAGRPADSGEAVLLGEVLLQASRDATLRSEVADVLAQIRTELARWVGHHRPGETAGPVAIVLAAALDALGMHRTIDPGLDLAGVEAALLHLVGGTTR